MEGNPIQALVVFLGFILVNAIMYSYGEALKNINENELEKRVDEGSKRAKKILKMIEKPDKLINTIQVISTATAIFVGFWQMNTYAATVNDWVFTKFGTMLRLEVLLTLSNVILAIYLGFLLLSVGVIVPKKIGAKYSLGVAFNLCYIAIFLMVILTPITWVITFFGNIILRIFGIDPNETYENVTEEEIISIVNEGHEQGVLEEREAEMISNIIELDEKQASNIMIHRNKIIYVDGNENIKNALDFMINANYSRFPVVEEDNIDNIIGIIHIKEVISEYRNGLKEKKVKDIASIRKPAFIPETRNIDDIFKEMQSEKNHMEIVVDEYGQTVGLLTMEDILEEIVGNIMDEYDVEENNIVLEKENVYLIKGMTALAEIADKLEVTFKQEDFDTLNGLLINAMGKIPEANEKTSVTVENIQFDILSVEKNSIALVRMTLPEKEQEENE